jgi:SAM-dependent methyltransferase
LKRVEKALTLYDGINEEVLSFVPSTAIRILDVGCGTGIMGERLCRNLDRSIVGITYSKEEADLASQRLSKVYCADLNVFDFDQLGTFDCVILSHILEHLYFPDTVLERIKAVLGKSSVVIVALPNVLLWKQRLKFLFGRWRYEDWGILDRTHFRFFDMRSSADLLEQAGYEILRGLPVGPFPLIREPLRKWMGPIAVKIDRFMTRLAPGLFAFQFVYLARARQ